MDTSLKNHIEYFLCVNIDRIDPVSGGDISKAYLLQTETERFFCKVNRNESAHRMFQAERVGLEAILETKTIAVPKVLLCDRFDTDAFLLMEYVAHKRPSKKDMELFGHQLAALHELSEADAFGWESDNFIGSLPQSNKKHKDWSEFYVQERLLPQLKLAKDGNRLNFSEMPPEEQLRKTCENLFPKVKPSLLHGDLWGGNYLIEQRGTPYLIDPATYFGHYEVDIAMTKLFGGFETDFYDAYTEHFLKIGGEAARTEIYQLYYLLVHLNLFGSSYLASVKSILKKYF